MSTVRAIQPDLRKKRINWQKVLVIVLFAIVPLFLLILFTYIPFGKMIQFSFHNMSYTKDKGVVGFDNYLRVFTKSEYVDAMLLSLYYMAGAVVQLALALLFASILSLERIRGSGIYKAILFFSLPGQRHCHRVYLQVFLYPGFCAGLGAAGHRNPAGKPALLAEGSEHQQLVAGVYLRMEILRAEHGAVYRGNRLDRPDAV